MVKKYVDPTDAAQKALAKFFALDAVAIEDGVKVVGEAPPYTLLCATAELLRNAKLADELDERSDQARWLIGSASTKLLLEMLSMRGGTFKAIADAQLLVLKKSEDYNHGQAAETANRDSYFPFGSASYAQMIHTKAQRLNSLTLKEAAGQPTNFEGIRDTLLDVINYASFWIERLDRE